MSAEERARLANAWRATETGSRLILLDGGMTLAEVDPEDLKRLLASTDPEEGPK
jgi:hypothetical protein